MTATRGRCPSCLGEPGPARRCGACGALLETRSFRVEALVSVGRRGRVYLATGPSGRVALKELVFAAAPDVKTIELFEREGQVLRELDHPRIPRFVDFFRDGNGADLRLYLAQAWLPGVTLENLVRLRRLDESVARKVAADILDVLAYLHSRSPALIHRDVKPANVFACADGAFWLVDFGAVRDLGKRPSSQSSVAGTFGYMPPEQLVRRADARSDLWALGMTLAHLLSRKEPVDLLTPDLSVEFRGHVNVSEAFAEFLEKLLSRALGGRFTSAARALAALEALPPVTGSGRARGKASPKVAQRAGWLDAVAGAERQVPPPRSREVRWVEPRDPVRGSGLPGVLEASEARVGLRPGGTYLVGRGPEANVIVDAAWAQADTVSRLHARLEVRSDHLRISDLKSRNGTRVGILRLLPGAPPVEVRGPVEAWLGSFRLAVLPWYR